MQTKIEELTHELNDVKGDLSVDTFLFVNLKHIVLFAKIFRQKRHRTRIDSNQKENNGKEINDHKEEQTILLERLEQANERVCSIEFR